MNKIPNPHPFDNLYRSTRQLHARFGTAQNTHAAISIVAEEWTEVQIEAYRLKRLGIKGGFESTKLAHETADLIVTLFGLCDLYGISYDQLLEGMINVADKNDAKIPGETHEINPMTGKVQRIEKGQS